MNTTLSLASFPESHPWCMIAEALSLFAASQGSSPFLPCRQVCWKRAVLLLHPLENCRPHGVGERRLVKVQIHTMGMLSLYLTIMLQRNFNLHQTTKIVAFSPGLSPRSTLSIRPDPRVFHTLASRNIPKSRVDSSSTRESQESRHKSVPQL